MTHSVIYACSHRRGGNSDRAAQLLAQAVTEAGGSAEVIYLRNHTVLPCLACGHCDEAHMKQGKARCVLGEQDDAYALFSPLFTARTVFFTAPIYFYHLPSLFKTWIDRSQQFWTAKHTGEPWIADLPKRTAHTVLHAGRPTGDKLFDGATLTLKYFLHSFNLTLATPLVFRGLDHRDDLKAAPSFEQQILDLGRTASASAQ
ncbi:flavodoxin family protein [Pseudodesulfovibrio sp. JC047]|uniref:flavodoxin family protein n=1 Tax=Pseudodesulfovibrio sp. JC047 TaxID=2683199 RepID=UPI0013D6F6B3|nr:flavodoxin family protein [Pseudodesulfovibrio sp. JC047]NDV18434.1 flavodoxin family protein [Pseudodesulfovibrio sp. JC047]